MKKEKSYEELLIENENLKNQLLAFTKDKISIKNKDARYKGLFDTVEAGVVVHLPDTSIIINNPKAAELLGLTGDELKGKVVIDPDWYFTDYYDVRLTAEDYPVNIILKTKSILKNYVVGVHRPKTNDKIWALVNGFPVIDKSGSIIEIVISFTDFTKRKKAEEELSNLAKELKKAHQIAQIGSWRLNLENDELTWTEELYKIFGFDPSIPPPPFSKQNKIFTPESWELLVNSIEEVKKTGDPYELELKIIKKDGSHGWLWVRSETVENKNGKTIGLLGTAQNITERKLAELELKKAKEKAEESDRLKSAFLANMSHEIRTPMNSILGFSSLLRDDELDKESKEKYIDYIESGGNRLLTIISDIIDISKIDANQIKLINKPCNINSLINELHSQFSLSLISSEVKLLAKPGSPNTDLIIETDQHRLMQIFSNLIENALKFTEKGTVEFGYTLSDNYINYYVKDTGFGIAQKDQELIFERFGQANQKHTFVKGTGLGLSIVKGLVKLLNGKIWLESEIGKGSTFYFSLPAGKIENKKVQSKPKENEISLKKEDFTILIAEDEESNYYYFEAFFAGKNYKLIRAKNGKEAIDLFIKHKNIDLILMDIKMPIMDGYEATQEIRKIDKSVPIIAQTAYAMQDDPQKAKQAGCNDYISKPIDKNEFINKINSYLG